MMHTKRKWCVTKVATVEELSKLLTETTFGCCHAFYIKGHPDYVWVNDSTAPDRLQEYAVLKRNLPDGEILQIESITTSWCTPLEMQQYIERSLAGKDDTGYFVGEVDVTLQTPKEHESCPHCA